jgi:hypothetical protein
VSDFVLVVVADGEFADEFLRAVQGEVGVVDGPDDPVGADDGVDEFEVGEVEYAAGCDPDVAAVGLGDGLGQAGDLGRDGVVQALQGAFLYVARARSRAGPSRTGSERRRLCPAYEGT